MGALEEARRLHQLSLAGKFKLNTAEDMDDGYDKDVDAADGEDDSDDEILNNPDKFRDESLGTLPAVRVRRDEISTFISF